MKRTVILRNGETAQVTASPATKAIGLDWQGRRTNGQLELWTLEGNWREDRTEHPLDIVRGLFTQLTAADLEKRSA